MFKKYCLAAVMLLFLMTSSALAQRIESSGSFVLGDGDNIQIGKIGAMQDAKRKAVDQAGIYIASLSVVKNNQLTHDDIISLSFGTCKLIPGTDSYIFTQLDSSRGIQECTVRAIFEVDDRQIEQAINDNNIRTTLDSFAERLRISNEIKQNNDNIRLAIQKNDSVLVDRLLNIQKGYFQVIGGLGQVLYDPKKENKSQGRWYENLPKDTYYVEKVIVQLPASTTALTRNSPKFIEEVFRKPLNQAKKETEERMRANIEKIKPEEGGVRLKTNFPAGATFIDNQHGSVTMFVAFRWETILEYYKNAYPYSCLTNIPQLSQCYLREDNYIHLYAPNGRSKQLGIYDARLIN